MLPHEQLEYLDERGRSPFARWFDALDDFAATRVLIALGRLSKGNISNVRSVGGGVSELKVDFGPGYRVYFGRAGMKLVILSAAGRRNVSRTTLRRRSCAGPTTGEGSEAMPLTRDFKETVMARLKRSPGFRAAMLREGVDALLGGEFEIGKEVLRDYVNATMGFDKLSKQVDIPPKSLMRMLGRSGNPQMKNLFAVIAALRRHAGIELHVTDLSPASKKKRPKRTSGPRRVSPVVYPQTETAAHSAFREAQRRFKRS